MTYNEIIAAIDGHLGKSSKQYYSNFYVGISDDIDERLHGFHKVPKQGRWFRWCPVDTVDIASNVEKHYLALGMDGGPGGGDDDTFYVYCYEIGPDTKER